MDASEWAKCFVVSFPPEIWAPIACLLYGEDLARLKMCGSKLLWRKLTLPGVVKSVNLGKRCYQIESWPSFLNDLPSVGELSIDSHSYRWRTRTWFSQSWARLGLMPPKLRKLDIKNVGYVLVNEYGTPSFIDKLLPRLEVLSLSGIGDEQWMARCPKSLTELRIARWSGAVPLPSRLIHLKIAANTWSSSMVLPKGLQTLQLSDPPPVSLLVPPLTSLAITSSSHFFEAPDNISQLPSTLTELRTYDWIPCSFWPHLPPKLTKLSFGISELIHDSVERVVINPTTGHKSSVRTLPLELLPRSISLLDCGPGPMAHSVPLVPIQASSYFPPKLKTLRIDRFFLTLPAARALPKSITRLELKNLQEDLCEYLPSGLTALKCLEMCSSPNLFSLLPRSLFELDLSDARDYAQYDVETGEPTGVEKRWTGHPKSFYDGKSLPSGLTSLKLTNCHEIDDSFIEDLALPNILTLDIQGANLTDRCVPHLPRLLARFSFDGENITGGSFPFLPRTLLHLGLSRATVSDSDIPHLPRTLTSADLTDATLTKNCFRDLPREMQTLILGDDSILGGPINLTDLPYALRRYAENYF